jgi:glucose/arabinose dehydrogenase
MKRLNGAVIVMIALFISACQPNAAAVSDQPIPSPTRIIPIATARPSPTPTLPPLQLPPADEAAQRITLPTGFAIRTFAQDLDRPRFMAFGPDGVMYVALMSSGEIARLPDVNRDGIADRVEVVAKDLETPHNLEWHEGWWYIAERDRVERFSATFDKRELVTDNIPCCGGHFTRTVHFGPDGKMYVSTGSSSNMTPETDPRRAAILRFNPD